MSRAHRFAATSWFLDRRHCRAILSLVFLSIAVISGVTGLWGCSSETNSPNRPPTVELTAGPTEGDTVRYNVPISWAGEDADGSVVRYEYAIDPNSSFSEDEIANGGPGIVSKLLKGQDSAPDTTRVTKASGASFDWVHTQEESRRFQFSTPISDSTFVQDLIVPTGRFYGMHAVYVRAVDDDGAPSSPDKVAFTAKTIAPRSRITAPDLTPLYGITLGNRLAVRWTGSDPDAGTRRPGGYEIAVVRLDPPYPIIVWPPPLEVIFRNATWTRISGGSFVTDTLTVPQIYYFGLRAVDENGVIEPFLNQGRNVFSFMTQAGAGTPQIFVSFGGLVYTFPSPGMTVPLQVPANRQIRISLSCSAETYGQKCNGFRWGSDFEHLGEWTYENQPHLTFPNAGTHIFYVQARDDLGNVTTAALIFHVISFSFEREVLLVDDSFDTLAPSDADHDAFWRDMISYYVEESNVSADQIGEFAVFGDGDRGNLQPNVPLLSDLIRYKVLIWENLGSGYNSDSALYRATVMSPLLATYLQAGGKLWLGGRMTVAATTGNYAGTGADLAYPKTELGAGDWAWDFLKLHSRKINNDKGTNNANLFHAARWFPRAMGGHMPAIYDTMSVDLDKLNMFQKSYGGFSHADAVFDPNYAETEPDFRGDIDTLYAYGATGPEVQGKTSQYQNKLCAIRWHDPDPDREHGRLQWFGFAMYFMHTDQARQTFKASLDWLREEAPPQ